MSKLTASAPATNGQGVPATVHVPLQDSYSIVTSACEAEQPISKDLELMSTGAHPPSDNVLMQHPLPSSSTLHKGHQSRHRARKPSLVVPMPQPVTAPHEVQSPGLPICGTPRTGTQSPLTASPTTDAGPMSQNSCGWASTKWPAQNHPEKRHPAMQNIITPGTASYERASLPSETALLNAISTAVTNTGSHCHRSTCLKVVSQILPCPMHGSGHSSPMGTFRSLMNALKGVASERCWIHVIHALPEHCAAKEMPTSPPTTPGVGEACEHEDYFNPKRVISNVSIMLNRHDYFQQQERVVSGEPGLVTPPATSDLSLYERIIPPSTMEEFRDLFSISGPSGFGDRLLELAPNGHLVFIYPTKNGCFAFQEHYLNPELVPLVRSVVYRNRLPVDTCAALSSAVAVSHMVSFENLQKKVESLLSQLATNAGDVKSSFALVSAEKGSIQLRDDVWKHWWVEQETPRIKHIMHTCLQNMGSRTIYKDEHLSARSLTSELLDGLANGAPGCRATMKCVEVGVFVIRRTT